MDYLLCRVCPPEKGLVHQTKPLVSTNDKLYVYATIDSIDIIDKELPGTSSVNLFLIPNRSAGGFGKI